MAVGRVSETVLHGGAARIICGDALGVLRTLPSESVDSIVTDPPYELGFMGKAWDRSGIAFNVDLWREALRVLKPGAHLLAFGGTRTHHRMVCAMEDAGFEIRDEIQWLYGQGFPKSLDVSKAIDKAAGAAREVISTGAPVKRMIPGADQNATGSWLKDNGREFVPTETKAATPEAEQWEGWGTALKPACEPICLARKPLSEKSVAANVLRWGVGALNIEASRVGDSGGCADAGADAGAKNAFGDGLNGRRSAPVEDMGRWPANVILDPEAAEMLDELSGDLTSGNNPATRSADKHRDVYAGWKGAQCLHRRGTNSGGASRFFYIAKASPSERDGSTHPTVKPLDLMKWLVRLVTPPGGLVCDPFGGSGTTAHAALLLDFRCVTCDISLDYCAAIVERICGVTPSLFSEPS